MTETSQSDLFDYEPNAPQNESETASQELSPSQNTSETTEDESNDPEGDEQPICPCLHEEQENWSDKLDDKFDELDISTVNCGHAIDYLCTNTGTKIKRSTAALYISKLRLFIAHLHTENTTVCDATHRDIKQYFDYRSNQNLSQNTFALYKAVITNLYKHIELYRDAQPKADWALIREEIDPAEFGTSEKVERDPLTKPELVKLLNETKCFRNRLMIRVAVELGPRNIDLCTMEISDVKLDEQEVELSNTKKGRTYTLPIADELTLLLRRWIDTERAVWAHSQDHDYLFPSQHGGHLDMSRFDDIVVNAAKRAGIQEVLKKIPLTGKQKEVFDWDKDYRVLHAVTPHTLRHTFTELLDEAGLSLEQRSDALDHASTEVTKNHYGSNGSGHSELMRDNFSGVDTSSE